MFIVGHLNMCTNFINATHRTRMFSTNLELGELTNSLPTKWNWFYVHTWDRKFRTLKLPIGSSFVKHVVFQWYKFLSVVEAFDLGRIGKLCRIGKLTMWRMRTRRECSLRRKGGENVGNST